MDAELFPLDLDTSLEATLITELALSLWWARFVDHPEDPPVPASQCRMAHGGWKHTQIRIAFYFRNALCFDYRLRNALAKYN